MNRKELYTKIKELNLQESIKNKYGDNYTRIDNKRLEEYVKNAISNISTPKLQLTKESVSTLTVDNTENKDKGKIDKLIELLKKKHILLDSEIAYINK